ncbi:MAG: hypothetical protein FD129_12 [bacterium]|nr:MAG: hypothetical protein FD129_12 [bacterium]
MSTAETDIIAAAVEVFGTKGRAAAPETSGMAGWVDAKTSETARATVRPSLVRFQ